MSSFVRRMSGPRWREKVRFLKKREQKAKYRHKNRRLTMGVEKTVGGALRGARMCVRVCDDGGGGARLWYGRRSPSRWPSLTCPRRLDRRRRRQRNTTQRTNGGGGGGGTVTCANVLCVHFVPLCV
ncbi:unnamed protein product [Haemonchus placei]|uniref:Uncharacterized protein n=1 Tax=Haemonchus placei TaxID=6290 RepID=A0A0N4WZR7_HAEPC|nr:unnamed protein product [Haemonchus placei]